jgi:hypothetical protein
MPSNKILEMKKAIVTGLADEFRQAQTMVFADYRGLTVAQDTELRTAMRKAGVKYKVIKNKLAVLAAQQAGIKGMEALFTGPTAVAYSNDDVVAPAKLVKDSRPSIPSWKSKAERWRRVPGCRRRAAPCCRTAEGSALRAGCDRLDQPDREFCHDSGRGLQESRRKRRENVSELVAVAAGE